MTDERTQHLQGYRLSHENGITWVQFLTSPSLQQVRRIIDELVARYPWRRKVWDLRRVDMNLTLDALRSISEYGKRMFTAKNCVAILVKDDLAYGQVRQFLVFRQEEKTAVQVFRDEERALEWLRASCPDSSSQ